MAKSERLFEMLEYIREYPYLTAQDLARLCNVSERGIYRYLNTLSRAGIVVRFSGDGYKLPEDKLDLLKRADVNELQAIRTLLSIGMRNCDDQELLKYGKGFMELVDENLPDTRSGMPDEIAIVPEGMKATNYGGTVTIGHSSRPDIINPILTAETISVTLMNLIFSSLLTFDGAQRPIPDLAKSWDISKDGLVWTFFLRDDVKFHDGHPLTAHDVEFTYKSIMDPKNISPKAGGYDIVDRVEAEGDYIFRVILKHPFAPFVHRLNRAIVPKHLLENVDLHDNPFNRRPVGSGPFKLEDWTEDDTIILNANREYFRRGRPVLDGLIFRTYPDREAALEAIARGEMDLALNLTALDLLFVSEHGSFRVYPVLDASFYAVVFNLELPIFRDIRVRKAFDYALDRDSIIENQLKGHSKICTGPFNVDSWAYNSHIQPSSYNVGKALELLEQAGWRYIGGDGLLYKDGLPFEISLMVPNISDSLERIAVAIRAQLMRVGIKVKIVYMDGLKPDKATLQAILVKNSTGADPDSAYRSWHSKDGDANLASYENKFVDDLLELGRRTMDLEKRKAIYHKVHEMIHDDYPAVFLASGREYIGSNYRFRYAGFPSTVQFLMTARDWQIVGGKRDDVTHEEREGVSMVS